MGTNPAVIVPPTPNYTPSPFMPGDRYVITTPGDFINVRETPSMIANKLGEIPNKSVVTIFEETLLGGEYWRKVHFGEFIGWISLQKGTVQFAPYLPPGEMMMISKGDWEALLNAVIALDKAIQKITML